MRSPRIALLKGVGGSNRNLKSSPFVAIAQCCQSTLSSSGSSPRGEDRGSQVKLDRIRPSRRFPKYLLASPNAILALRIKSRVKPLTWQTWSLFRAAARSKSLRLPIVTVQVLMRQDERHMETSLSECLGGLAEWKARLNSLAFKGIGAADLDDWAWILAAEDEDARIERFVSSGKPKPIFLLFLLLRKDATFQKGSSFVSLLDHIAQHHIRGRAVSGDAQLPFGAVRRSLDSRLNMTPQTFAMTLRLLVRHCLRVWPSAITSVAHLVSSYIEQLESQSARRSAYTQRCFIFNYALQLFQRRSHLSPVSQMKYNWRAQKSLLSLSTRLPRPLIIDRLSYRALRRVMLALKKSSLESMVAARLTRTWPPYRQDWDGVDERRLPEDDLSRNVKAGNLMRESGYSDDDHSHALSILGGAVPGVSPSIQTRSLPPKVWTGRLANMNVYVTWAARVRATRNAHEAWKLFKSHPMQGIRPNFQVYAEMFEKLLATGVPQTSSLLPGDTKNTFPVYDDNLTEFEKARLNPPSVGKLYDQMLHEGLRPVGTCLSILVQNAPSTDKALAYLNDSPTDKEAVALLDPATATATGVSQSAYEALRRIPLPVFNAYITHLCKFQPRVTTKLARKAKISRISLLQHALRITSQRLPYTMSAGAGYKAPWHSILRLLAAPNVLVDPRCPSDPALNDAKALSIFMDVFSRVETAMGTDIVLFETLCKAIQKALDSGFFKGKRSHGPASSREYDAAPVGHNHLKSLRVAHAALTAAFGKMIQPSVANPEKAPVLRYPSLSHSIQAAHLHHYMRALGYLGDVEETVRVVRWMLEAWEDETVLEDAKDPESSQHGIIAHALTFFRAFAEKQVSADVMEEIKAKMLHLRETKGCTWGWPATEDVERYIRYDDRPGTRKFWERVRADKSDRAQELAAFPQDVAMTNRCVSL